MNNANAKIRVQTAVDALNAALLLLKMEGDRFEEQRQDAWYNRNGDLIPIGLKIHGFWVSIEDKAMEYVCTVKDDQG